MPENPLDMLKPTWEEYKNAKSNELQTLPKLEDDAEVDERYYIFLSVVHDKYLPGGHNIIKGIWPDDLKEAVWPLCDEFFGDKTIFLKCALDSVKQRAEKNGGKK